MTNSLSITITPAQRKWLEKEIAKGDGTTPERYLRDLLEKERRRQERRRIEDALEEGLASGGKSRPLNASTWKRIHAMVKKRANKKSG